MKHIGTSHNDACLQARSWLAAWVDGDLKIEEATWLDRHWEACGVCLSDRERFRSADRSLVALSAQIVPPEPPAVEWARLLARFDQEGRGWRSWRWFPAAAALLSAAILLAFPSPSQRPSIETATDANGFVEIPFVPAAAPYERTSVVTQRIQVSALLAAGYRISADPSLVVEAEVLLGEDGQPHAVRVDSAVLKGMGD